MSTHTPGPWRVSNPQSPECALVITDDLTIARAYVGDKAPATANANAHLIAAAPDLLAALKYLLELGGDDDRRIAAEAAIAKAEGR
jgi:hypothetical protein